MRTATMRSVALSTAGWTALAAAPTVGDFELHNAGTCAVSVTADAASGDRAERFVLRPGRTLSLRGIDINALAARSELPGAGASISITGLFGA